MEELAKSKIKISIDDNFDFSSLKSVEFGEKEYRLLIEEEIRAIKSA